MVITGIAELTKARVLVTIDEEESLVLYKGDLRSRCIREGEELPESVYRELTEQVLPKRATLRCMELLKRRDYTEAELKRKLEAGGYPERAVSQALHYVMSYGYVDDKAYTEKYIETYRDRKSMSRMEAELLQKGISREMIQDARRACMDGGEEDFELAQIRALLSKKGYREEDCTQETRRKLCLFLMRRGYPYSKISHCMKEM